MVRLLEAAMTRPRASTSTAIVPEYFRRAARESGGIHFGSGRTTATAGSYATGSLAVTRMGAGTALATAVGTAAGGAGPANAAKADTVSAAAAGSEGGSGAATIERAIGVIGGGGSWARASSTKAPATSAR